MFEESAELLSQCAYAYKLYDLTQMYDFDRSIKVENGRKENAKIGTKEHFVYPLTQSEVEKLDFVYTYPTVVDAPMSKDTEIGKVEIFLNNDLLFCEKIFTIEDVKPKSILQRMQDFFENW
jgi:D-alanyl-D-alanine carboxypeptidase